MKKPVKKYFIKDESLRGIDDDQFNYAAIARVLDDIISTNTPPFNVAVIGKWGLGKSSLINLVIGRYRKADKHYQIQEINAWKYEKESLRKVFLKQLWQGISGQRIQSFETVKRELANLLNADEPKTKSAKSNGRTKRFCLAMGLILVVSVIAFIAYKIIQALSIGTPIWTWAFWTQVFLRYCKNVSTVLIGPIFVALGKLLIDDYHAKQSKKIELNFPIETTDDYEIFLETKIRERLRENPELKIITVIDDLDRLSIDKIVEALDALKAFVGFERCIFIVPFDDEIIKRALDKRRTKEFNNQSEITDVVESELILDKLFQYKIYLPPILDFDIQQYAYKLAQQEAPDFIAEYCNESIMKKVVNRILIYPGVSTPRQVKKLLNAFINNLMIVSAREASGKIQHGLLTSEEGIMQIAKLSVLQADFNNFFDLLFKDMRCIDLLPKAHMGEMSPDELPEYLQNYFEKTDETKKLKREHETLLNFLHRTTKYHVSSIAPYLYLAQNEISIKTGDELQRRAINALKSRNEQTLRMLLKESGDLAEAIAYHLSRETEDVEDMLWASMMVYEDVEIEHKTELAQCIIERNIELSPYDSNFLYTIPSNIIFGIASNGETIAFNQQFIERYLSVLLDNSKAEKNKTNILQNALPEVFRNISSLSDTARTQLKNICDFCIEDDSIDAASLFDAVDTTEPEFIVYWGKDWLMKLCTYMESEEDFTNTTSKQLLTSIKALRQTLSADEIIELILPLLQYEAFLPIADTIINTPDKEDGSECIKSLVSQKMATALLENIFTHNFENNEKYICRIVDSLRFIISDDNAEEMDAFTMNYRTSYELDNVLLYCGQQGFFDLLPTTIKSLIEDVFNNEQNDELLIKIACYFTDTQKETLANRLAVACAYNTGKTYERELAIIGLLVNLTDFTDVLENVCLSKILQQFPSYNRNADYRNFVSQTFALIKDTISQDCIDKYIHQLISMFSSNCQFVLEAINKVSMKMSSDTYREVFQKITEQSEAANFELAFEIIQNHETLRPKDNDNLHRYMSFLVKNLSTAEDPDHLLHIICCSFTSTTLLRDMAVNANENPNCSEENLAKALAHFINHKKDIEDVSNLLKTLCEADLPIDLIYHTIDKNRTFAKGDIYSQLANTLASSNNPQILTSYTKLACHDLKTNSAQKLVLDCLQHSFEKVDYGACALKILDSITENAPTFKERKDDLADILRSGFTTTTSDELKKAIVLVVSNLRIKPQFKKTLTGENLDYYKKWAS